MISCGNGYSSEKNICSQLLPSMVTQCSGSAHRARAEMEVGGVWIASPARCSALGVVGKAMLGSPSTELRGGVEHTSRQPGFRRWVLEYISDMEARNVRHLYSAHPRTWTPGHLLHLCCKMNQQIIHSIFSTMVGKTMRMKNGIRTFITDLLGLVL